MTNLQTLNNQTGEWLALNTASTLADRKAKSEFMSDIYNVSFAKDTLVTGKDAVVSMKADDAIDFIKDSEVVYVSCYLGKSKKYLKMLENAGFQMFRQAFAGTEKTDVVSYFYTRGL